MAHFAKIENGSVVQVLVVSDDDAPSEVDGQNFLHSLGLEGEWVQTSFENDLVEGQNRGKYAGIGDVWDGKQFSTPGGDQ